MRQHAKVRIPSELSLSPSTDIRTGQIVSFSTEFALPRYRKILNCSMTPGKGTVTSLEPRSRKVKSRWHWDQWRIEGKICALTPGETEKGSLVIELSPEKRDGTPERFTLEIPSFKISELPAIASPAVELAGAAKAPQKISPYWHFLWLLLLLPLLLFFFRKRVLKEQKVTLRQRTLNSLESLRSAVLSRKLSAKEGIAGVSDQLRFYLEERYGLPDSGMTTPEFLEDVEYNSSVPETAGTFLRNFLNSADMIKFAQAPCDSAAVNSAVDSAVDLVRNTAVPETEEKNV